MIYLNSVYPQFHVPALMFEWYNKEYESMLQQETVVVLLLMGISRHSMAEGLKCLAFPANPTRVYMFGVKTAKTIHAG